MSAGHNSAVAKAMADLAGAVAEAGPAAASADVINTSELVSWGTLPTDCTRVRGCTRR